MMLQNCTRKKILLLRKRLQRACIIVVFGSATKGKRKPTDIDILVILDDVRLQFSEDVVQTYRIIAQKIIADTHKERLHVQSMKFSSFWEYVRAGDPVATNITVLPWLIQGFSILCSYC